MTDYFALLGEPRRPWLEAEQLKVKFHKLSAQAHPDKASAAERETANQRFAGLNSAYNCLRDPKERLRHLLELALGKRPSQTQVLPAGLMDWFGEIAGLRRDVQAFLAEARKVKSPLLRVELFERAQDWTDRLRAVQHRLNDRENQLLHELQVLDGEWVQLRDAQANRSVLLQRLEHIQQELGFCTRWSGQLQETIVQLAL
jgi:DnaJ-domain-containing protein 1